MYTESDLVRIAKRDNNTKRTYLVVNPLQGKHIPVVPSMALELYAALAAQVKQRWTDEKLLLVGFAETATAIGAGVAAALGCDYIQTTREIIADVDYLFFSESHSHATEQKLVRNDIDAAIGRIDRIVFVEDEVTTGNTILNIIAILEQLYPGQVRYGVASLLNGMNEEYQAIYQAKEIPAVWLVKTNHDTYEDAAARAENNGTYCEAETDIPAVICQEYQASHYQNARRLVNGASYAAACEALWNQTKSAYPSGEGHRILVLGTEEFMYPALYLAGKLEEQGQDVRFHATTRSPISVSRDAGYPLHTRYRLASCYDKDRTTFVYNLDQYDAVYVVTDAPAGEAEGINTLVNALAAKKNQTINIIRWCAQ